MRAEYREGERFSRLDFTEETFYDCDFSDCTFIDCTFENCKLDHSVLSECQFIRCTITDLKTTMSRAKFTDLQGCTLNNIEWMSLQGDGSFADPIEKLQDCRLKYNTFWTPNFTSAICAKQTSRRPADIKSISSAASCRMQNFHCRRQCRCWEI